MSNVSSKFLKAKPGDLFVETVAQREHGAVNAEPRVLTFLEIIYTDPETQWKNPDKVKFIDDEGNEVIVVADDRYGYYPRLDAAKIAKMQARLQQLKAEMKTITHVLDQLKGPTA